MMCVSGPSFSLMTLEILPISFQIFIFQTVVVSKESVVIDSTSFKFMIELLNGCVGFLNTSFKVFRLSLGLSQLFEKSFSDVAFLEKFVVELCSDKNRQYQEDGENDGCRCHSFFG